jgi:uncharacterized membrane protein
MGDYNRGYNNGVAGGMSFAPFGSEEARGYEAGQQARRMVVPVGYWYPEKARDRTGAIAYITIFGAAYALFLSKEKGRHLVRFHAVQSILMSLIGIVAIVTLGQPLETLVSFVFLGFWAVCLYRAGNGKYFRVPLVGWLAESIVGRIPNPMTESMGIGK